MKAKILIFIGVGLLFLIFYGCKKPGCTDSKATNFDAKATKDDGSCKYPPPSTGGNSTNTAAKGPLNPSFETGDANGTGAASWTRYSWHEQTCPTYGLGNPHGWRNTGTSFMPTKGIWYVTLSGWDNGQNRASDAIYQDSVDLSNCSTLTFDYLATGVIPLQSAKVTVNFLFTANGTSTLWTKEFSHASGVQTSQKTGETISLPSLPDKGRLRIEVRRPCDVDNLYFHFSIDNISVL